MLRTAIVTGALVLAACAAGRPPAGFSPPAGDDGGSPPGAGDGGGGLIPPGVDGGLGQGVASVFFDPATVTLNVDGVTPQTASFALKVKDTSGSVSTVTPESLAFDRPDLAAMALGAPSVLTASGQAAGLGNLQAVYQGHVASAKLEVSVHVRDIGPGVPPGAATGLDGPSSADPAIGSLLYPYDRTVFPLGITSPLLMWTAPNPGDAYRLHYEEKDYVYDAYRVVAQPAQVRLDQVQWDRLTASNQGDPLNVTVSRWDATKAAAYASAQQSWTIAPASLRGAIYYWTTSSGGHMSRINPGTGALPQVLPGANGIACMGCHAVSADGSTLVAAVGDSATGGESTAGSPPGPNQAEDQTDERAWFSFDLPNVTVRKQSNMFAGNLAVTPKGEYVVFGDETLYVADTATGQYFTGTGLDNVALDPGMVGLMMPAFSPDGARFVAVEGGGPASDPTTAWYQNLVDGKLLLLDFHESTHTFTNPRGLAATSAFPAGQRALSYPTFSPDGNWVAFHVGDYATGCDAQGCDASSTQIGAIYLQSTTGAPPVRLSALTDSSPNAADHNVTFEPTFNPIARGGYFWLVVSSSRDWGNRVTGTPNNGKKRLWAAAIDATPGATDPSHPGFFIEGQEEQIENMRGFWALAACIPTVGGGACTAGFECCSGFCDKGKCVDKGGVACAAVGDQCAQDGDCCNAPYVRCTNGTCEPAPPK